jgi:hypothetical protein
MDALNEYRRIIRDLIQEYARHEPSVGEVRTEVVFDEAHDHYELLHTGWIGSERVHGSVLHFDIRDGKVWIEHNGTEDPIGTLLVEAGIPRESIVLGFRSPAARQHTGFAVS